MVAIQEILLPLSGAIALAIQALLLRVATRKRSVSDVILIVYLVNSILLVPVVTVLSYPDYNLTTRSVVAFVGAGLIGTGLGRIALFTGIQRIGASRAEPIKASAPFFAAIIAVIVLGERMTTEHLLGVVLIVIGIAVISWEQASGPDMERTGPTLGLVFPLLAALCFAVEPVFAKTGFDEGTPFLVGLSIKILAAALGFVGYLQWHHALPTTDTFRGSGLSWAVAAGLANTAFLIAFYASLSAAPVVLVVPIIQASPLFVVALSYVFLQDIERVTGRLAVGVSVVVTGGVLVAVHG